MIFSFVFNCFICILLQEKELYAATTSLESRYDLNYDLTLIYMDFCGIWGVGFSVSIWRIVLLYVIFCWWSFESRHMIYDTWHDWSMERFLYKLYRLLFLYMFKCFLLYCCSKDFVMHVGGSVWALDWCPRVHNKPDCHTKCEVLVFHI